MVELDMVHVSYFGGFLSVASSRMGRWSLKSMSRLSTKERQDY